jgi:hypothetical protein
MKVLILNSSNVVNNGLNDTYLYRFPAGAIECKDDQIAVSSISLYYSWYNINQSVYNNNSFRYTWIDATEHTVAYPDGAYYTVADLNSYFQSVMYTNNHYLVNSTTGQIQYLMEFVENATFYAVQFNAFVVNTTLPDGFELPAGATWSLPVSPRTAQITIVSNNFGALVGLTPRSYPAMPTSTTYSITSNTTPQISPINSIVVSCSLVRNTYSVPSTLLYAFAPNTRFGSLITTQPNEHSYVDIQDGQYTDVTIKFSDQLLRTIAINDNNVVIMLTIRNKYENTDKINTKANR